MSRKDLPEINAGSMADIAFLLLIFFLVSTTMEVDSGILRKIPQKLESQEKILVKERNILEINMNKNNELFVENKIIELKDLKQIAIDFIDNAGGKDKNGNVCNWCEGKQLASSSEHPSKAIISIKADRAANYETYISVLDNLNAAYTKLRNQLSVKRYNQHYTGLMEDFKKSNHKEVSIQAKIKDIREKYPLLLSDIEINN